MGWNAGYRIMEATVVSIYDMNKLTSELLEAVMEPFKETDCDSGGSVGLKAKDGLGVEEIICKVMDPEGYARVKADPQWYEGEEPDSGNHHGWESSKSAYDLFMSIWRDRWGIW